MNGPSEVLVDTNLIILGVGGSARVRELLDGRTLFISIVTEIELLSIAFPRYQDEWLIRDFISNCNVIELDGEVKTQTIKLRRGHKIKIPDAIIAASSPSRNLPLFTADKAFSRISSLNLVLV